MTLRPAWRPDPEWSKPFPPAHPSCPLWPACIQRGRACPRPSFLRGSHLYPPSYPLLLGQLSQSLSHPWLQSLASVPAPVGLMIRGSSGMTPSSCTRPCGQAHGQVRVVGLLPAGVPRTADILPSVNRRGGAELISCLSPSLSEPQICGGVGGRRESQLPCALLE